MITTVEDLIKALQVFDPNTEVYFGSANGETLDIETVPITTIENGFAQHGSSRIEFSDVPPIGKMELEHPSWVSPAIRIV